MSARSWAVIVLNMGGPDSLDAVEPFLTNLLADPELVRLPFPLRLFQARFARFAARRRAGHAREGYERMGGGSPLVGHTARQARAIARALAARGVPAEPFVAMRYWHPFAREVAAQVRALDPEGIALVSLYPQFSHATSGSSLGDMRRALEEAGLGGLRTVVIDRFPLLDGYVEATAASVARSLDAAGTPVPHVLFSAHGLPRKYVARGDPYLAEIEATYRAVRERIDPTVTSSLAFQSRVGPGEWLRPYTADEMSALAGRGVRRLVMVPLGFVSDHIETLFEMDEEYAHLARSLGMEFRRAPALNDDPVFTDALASCVHARLNGAA
jgi:ferrochelatase